jgi:hypothetical protein
MNYYNYFTEIEEHFVRRRGKHLFVSPLDWNLIASWRDSGIPLNVVLRGIDIAMDTYLSKHRRPGEKLSTLAYCHDSVMSEYARHLEAYVGESLEEKEEEGQKKKADGPAKDDVTALLSARIREIKSAREKHYTEENAAELDRALSRLAEIEQIVMQEKEIDIEALERDLGILDEILVESLRAVVPPEQSAAWEKEAKAELKIYKKQLPDELFQKIRRNHMKSKVHKYFSIGELSLFHL